MKKSVIFFIITTIILLFVVFFIKSANAEFRGYEYIDSSFEKISDGVNDYEYEGTGTNIDFDDGIDSFNTQVQAYHYYKGPVTDDGYLSYDKKHYIRVKGDISTKPSTTCSQPGQPCSSGEKFYLWNPAYISTMDGLTAISIKEPTKPPKDPGACQPGAITINIIDDSGLVDASSVKITPEVSTPCGKGTVELGKISKGVFSGNVSTTKAGTTFYVYPSYNGAPWNVFPEYIIIYGGINQEHDIKLVSKIAQADDNTITCLSGGSTSVRLFYSYTKPSSGEVSLWKDDKRLVLYKATLDKAGEYSATGLTAKKDYIFSMKNGSKESSPNIAQVTCSATGGVSGQNPPDFTSKLFPQCNAHPSVSLNCWSKEVFKFASVAVAIAAIVMIAVGGVLYITSGGDPGRTGSAKKIMFNALMGVTVLVLANWFFRAVLGIWVWNLQ